LWKSSGGCESSWNCGVRASRGVGVLLYDIDATVKEISSDDFAHYIDFFTNQPIKKSSTFFIISQPIYIYSCNRN
jgi:hypothetical protein